MRSKWIENIEVPFSWGFNVPIGDNGSEVVSKQATVGPENWDPLETSTLLCGGLSPLPLRMM